MLAAMSLIHGGASFSIFSHTIFNFLCGKHAAKLYPKIEEVADTTCKDLLCKVSIAIHVYVYKNVIKCIYLFFTKVGCKVVHRGVNFVKAAQILSNPYY